MNIYMGNTKNVQNRSFKRSVLSKTKQFFLQKMFISFSGNNFGLNQVDN